MSCSNSTPLSEEEIRELDSFLLSEACDEESLAIDEAHGFLTALIVGPKEIGQKQWLESIWGEPRFSDNAQQEHLTSLLVRLNGEIAANLARKEPFEPLVVEEEEEGEIFEAYEGWCVGFMMGVDYCIDLWDPLPKEQQALLAPMAQLALLAGDEEPEMDEHEYWDWVELLPGAVSGLYGFWHGGMQE